MADINLSQEEADALLGMEKHRVNEDRSDFPMRGESVTLPLQSADKREQFLLDLSRGRAPTLRALCSRFGCVGGMQGRFHAFYQKTTRNVLQYDFSLSKSRGKNGRR